MSAVYRRLMWKSGVIASLLSLVFVLGCTGNGETPSASTAGASTATTVGASGGFDSLAPTATTAPGVSFDALSGRAAHTATMLLSGDVLVAGGCITDGCAVATAETFIVASDGASVVRGPDLTGPRDGHTATALADGSVVLIAGYAGEGQPPLASVEVFDAVSRNIRTHAHLHQRRGGHASALLTGDRVLVVGGWIARRTYTSTAEVVDISSGSVTEAAQLPVALHAMDAVTLADGRVLVTGGQIEGGEGTNGAWIYDAPSDSWSETGPMTERRFKHVSVLLPDGRVLVIGGTTDDREILSTTEIYHPVSGSFTPGPDLVEPRYKLPGGAVVIDGDRVVVGGGGRTIEIIDLASGTSIAVEDLGSQGSFATTTALGDGRVLVLGGYDRSIDLRRQVRLIPST